MTFLLLLSLNLNCFAQYVHKASGIEIRKDKIQQTRKTRSHHVNVLLSVLHREGKGKIDSRILAVAYLENRLRIYAKRGDRGQACGIFQIHAKHSYPMFHRKRGFIGWKPKENKNIVHILRECSKLENVNYSVKTMNRFVGMMEDRKLHVCHHNSGFKGKCNSWYKKRLNVLYMYFETAKLLCSERVKQWL